MNKKMEPKSTQNPGRERERERDDGPLCDPYFGFF